MTKANSVDPPKLATWLLEQFSPVPQNAPLAGDLIEAFRQGRSSGWYWRQVFWAILIGLLNLFRKRPGYLAYAALCSGLTSIAWLFVLLSLWGPSSALRTVFALYAKGLGMQWPWSLVYQIAFLTIFQAVIVASALIAYLVSFRILNPGKLLRALILVVAVLASGNVASTVLGNRISTTPTDLVQPSIPASCEGKVTSEGVSAAELVREGEVKCKFILSGIRFPCALVWMLFSTPAMLALLVGIWKANPRSSARPTPA